MNCEVYQDRLVDALAGREGALHGELAGHLRACAECRKFYETQVHLFGAIDSGVRAMVNMPVPPSLLQGVRARVAEAGIPRPLWGLTWGLASVAIVAVLVGGVGFWRRGPENTGSVRDRSAVGTQRVQGAAGVTPMQPRIAAAAPRHKRAEVKVVTAPRESVQAPEVLVLPEERAAFARFVADLPEAGDAAVAFTRPATDAKDEAVEIALLQIDELEVKPLESSNRD